MLAVVVATSREIAEQAVTKIKVVYKPNKVLIHAEDALKVDHVEQFPWRIEGGCIQVAFQAAERMLSGLK